MSRAAEKLRRQRSYAGEVHVFINTSRFNEPEENYANSIRIPLPTQTASTIVLTKAALWGLRKIYRRDYQYQKAGVMLSGVVNAEMRQADLFGLLPKRYSSSKLMDVVDVTNNRMGHGTIRVASEGIKKICLCGGRIKAKTI